VLEDRRSRDV